MRSERAVIDYALARRALLADLFAGRVSTTEVCDAHPYLLRAAKHHGVATTRDCPVCRKAKLDEVSYAYGDALKDASGAARSPAQLQQLEAAYPELAVYVVEVCRRCSWNHLVQSFTCGSAPAVAKRTRARGL